MIRSISSLLFTFSIAVFLPTYVFAGSTGPILPAPLTEDDDPIELRNCSFTGMSVRCGDAMALVKCEGYDSAFHMLNSQEIKALDLDAYKGEPGLDRELQKNVLTIQGPRASSRAYSLMLAWHGDEIAKGMDVSEDREDYQLAIDDIKKAISIQGLPDSFVIALDDLTTGDFKIDSSADLYKKCDSSQGVAERSN